MMGKFKYKASADVLISCEYEFEAVSLVDAKKMVENGEVVPVSKVEVTSPMITNIAKVDKKMGED